MGCSIFGLGIVCLGHSRDWSHSKGTSNGHNDRFVVVGGEVGGELPRRAGDLSLDTPSFEDHKQWFVVFVIVIVV